MQHTSHHQHNARPPRAPAARERGGRALVECIIALLVLSVSALSMAATTQGTLALADDATLVSQAQAMATSRVEDALTVTCGNAAAGTDLRPRLALAWQQNGSAHQHQLHLDLTMVRSPIAFRAARQPLSIEAGGVCP